MKDMFFNRLNYMDPVRVLKSTSISLMRQIHDTDCNLYAAPQHDHPQRSHNMSLHKDAANIPQEKSGILKKFAMRIHIC